MEIILICDKHILPVAKILRKAYFDSLQEAKKYVRNKFKRKECFIAVENDRLLGVMAYQKDYSHYANYMADILVLKQYRGRGIAMQLIKKFIEKSKKETPKKQKYALSSTRITNKASINLHLKAGFKKIGRLKGLHYGKDEIFFAYKLSESIR